MIVADAGRGRDDTHAAAALVGLAQMPELSWEEADGGLAGSLPAVLVAEAVGVPDAVIARVLPSLAAFARDAAASVVVTLTAAQIDLVSAFLLGPRVQLLCEPSMADRAAALVIARAAQGAGGVAEIGGEEAERLTALAREVARIGAVLAELASRREVTASVGDRTTGFSGPPPERTDPPVTAAELRAAIRSRRLRDAEFGTGWFEEPAWDMLLDLFAAELEGAQVSVSSLCIAAAVAPTTALRWIGKMTAAGLLVRRNDSRDRRRAFMHLTERSRQGLTRYCAIVKRAGLPIG